MKNADDRTGGIRFRSLILLAGCFLAACDKVEETAPPLPTVTVAPVQERNVQDFYVFTGRTEAVETVEVRARVSGYLAEVRFKDGQEVKKGDVLFVIDPRPYQADVDRAQAESDQAQADLQLATIEFNRARELRNRQTISAQDFDGKSAAYLKAQSGLAAAKATLDTAKLNLEFTAIRSPIDGQASRASITPGNLVTPELPAPLTVIVSTNPIYAYADVDERKLLGYLRQSEAARGQSAEPANEEPRAPIQLQLADEKEFPHEGFIDFSENRVNRSTGTIAVRGVFEDHSKVLVPGMFVRLRIPSGPAYPALLVPQHAVGVDQGQKFVYSVDRDGVVEYGRVETGALQPDGWQIVRGGVKAGDSVIVDGLMKARPGEKVKAKPWNAPAPPSSGPVSPEAAR